MHCAATFAPLPSRLQLQRARIVAREALTQQQQLAFRLVKLLSGGR
jgi:hypothetical protein